MDDKLEVIGKLVESIKKTEYETGKFGIFNYNTLDEADPSKERVRSDLTVEIGGPSTHIKFTVLTREEHTEIREAVKSILTKRLENCQTRMAEACKSLAK